MTNWKIYFKLYTLSTKRPPVTFVRTYNGLTICFLITDSIGDCRFDVCYIFACTFYISHIKMSCVLKNLIYLRGLCKLFCAMSASCT